MIEVKALLASLVAKVERDDSGQEKACWAGESFH